MGDDKGTVENGEEGDNGQAQEVWEVKKLLKVKVSKTVNKDYINVGPSVGKLVYK